MSANGIAVPGSERYEPAKCSHVHHWRISFGIIHSKYLGEALCDETSFVTDYFAVLVSLYGEDPPAPDWYETVGALLNRAMHLLLKYGAVFPFNGLFPLGPEWGLHAIGQCLGIVVIGIQYDAQQDDGRFAIALPLSLGLFF